MTSARPQRQELKVPFPKPSSPGPLSARTYNIKDYEYISSFFSSADPCINSQISSSSEGEEGSRSKLSLQRSREIPFLSASKLNRRSSEFRYRDGGSSSYSCQCRDIINCSPCCQKGMTDRTLSIDHQVQSPSPKTPTAQEKLVRSHHKLGQLINWSSKTSSRTL